jgi:hypothetical protein
MPSSSTPDPTKPRSTPSWRARIRTSSCLARPNTHFKLPGEAEYALQAAWRGRIRTSSCLARPKTHPRYAADSNRHYSFRLETVNEVGILLLVTTSELASHPLPSPSKLTRSKNKRSELRINCERGVTPGVRKAPLHLPCPTVRQARGRVQTASDSMLALI